MVYSFSDETHSVQTALTDSSIFKAIWEKTGPVSLACAEPSSEPRGLGTTGIPEASRLPAGVSWCWWWPPGCWGGQPSVESSFCLQWKKDPQIHSCCDTRVQWVKQSQHRLLDLRFTGEDMKPQRTKAQGQGDSEWHSLPLVLTQTLSQPKAANPSMWLR